MGLMPLLDVLQKQKPRRRPIWLMRQAGRYLPEYRKVRADAGSFLDLCYDPARAAEVTLQPLRRYDLDAAIVFADILLVPHAMGCDVHFKENEGPILSPVRDERSVARLSKRLQRVEAVYETVQRVKADLPGTVALIGFCGAPWTVASYMIEGGSSLDRLRSRTAALASEPWFVLLIDRLVESSVEYLTAQVRAGADVLQIFDSWAGDLPASQWSRWVYEPIRRIVEGVRANVGPVPVIGFARGLGAGHLDFAGASGVNAVGCEQGVPVKFMADVLAPSVAVQGNLDPLALLQGREVLMREVNAIVSGLPAGSHIFNLGHGVRQETPPEAIAHLISVVRDFDGVR